MKNSIYYKILIGYIIFATLSLLLINTVISYKVMNMETARQAAELSSQADSVSSYCIKNNYYVHNSSNSSFNSSSDNYQKNMDRIPLTQDITLWIAGPANTILYSSFPQENPEKLPNLSEYFKNTYYAVGDFFGETKEEWLTVYSPIEKDGQNYGYVILNKPMPVVKNSHTRIMNMINITFIMMFAISMIILVIFSVCVYKPLTKIMTASKEYARGNYKYKGLKIHSQDEMKILADSLTFMSSAFQNLYTAQKKFIANISHDFRSPLTSIKGYLEAMLDGTIPLKAQEKYLNIVLSETERLNKLTGSLLTLNSFDANGTMLELTDFDFLTIAKSTIASFEGQCNAKNIKIRLNHEHNAYLVHADQMKIQQVIYNLIDNAIKFSPNDSEIIITVYNKNGKVFIAVKDFGVGISSENQLKIWDRFYKVDDSRGKDKKGTGLGLAIVKEIIVAHNENINVISTEGVGTQFVFSLSKGKG